MRYAHYCESCDGRSPVRYTRHDAKQDRADHRHQHHGDLRPADRIEEVPGFLSATAGALAADARRAAREGVRAAGRSSLISRILGETSMKQALRLLLGGVGVIVVIEFVTRCARH
ncbi:hypothetical protein [Streptomyces sp. NPDC048644]|uniref:hypothetical protein n=1 Tax=Streptomyces sp. NPDC048644 TaxID=3365582 RepID=UPI003719376C